MSTQSWDPDPEAGEALRSAVETYGTAVLSNPKVLSNLFKDLLPDSPRQAFLLVTAAENDVAASLERRFRQRMGAANALRAVATTLSENWAIELPAALWATAEFARALGYPLTDGSEGSVAPSVPSEEEATIGWTQSAPIGSATSLGSADTVLHRPANDQATTVVHTLRPASPGLPPDAGRADHPDSGPTGPGRSRRRLVLLAVALVVLAVAVVGVVLHVRSKGNRAGGGAPASRRLVFADQFTDPGSGWAPDVNQRGAGTGAYAAGAYRLTALRPNQPFNTFSAHSPYTTRLTSMAVTVDAAIERGAPADGAGVRCDQGSRSGLRYTFEVHRDGSWAIFQLGEPGSVPLLQGRSPAVRSGDVRNTITGQCTEVTGGTRLTMTVNGQVLGSIVNSHVGGPIAWHAALIIYRSLPSPATVVGFTNFRIYSVPAP